MVPARFCRLKRDRWYGYYQALKENLEKHQEIRASFVKSIYAGKMPLYH
jgi:hypothetical protein